MNMVNSQDNVVFQKQQILNKIEAKMENGSL